ncbi:uracil-DNA glycosylase [Pseudorhodobacter ferrugineus]|uniref:uracil-DNA glycosylase n=1 Tax=Pseudorhodobacter ferrugineus TaxID=77008 RepID=UPI0003B41169|nr:uracil-DNA glycosylase [Pseudorhodobacter ferrugineus]
MGIDTHIADYTFDAALAALAWQVELGVDEVMVEAAIDRYALPEKQEPVIAKAKAAAPVVQELAKVDTVAAANAAANACTDLVALRAALEAFDHCDLKKGARNLVFADGNPTAPLMVIGEAPSREEGREGRPFVGPAGALLDKMLAAIGHARGEKEVAARAAYLTTALPWGPPGDRDPTDEEVAMMQPFLLRHIALVKPRVIIAMGNTPCAALLGQRGVTRLRGIWATGQSIPVMPMVHPDALLRNPAGKRDAWADLLAIQARLNG